VGALSCDACALLVVMRRRGGRRWQRRRRRRRPLPPRRCAASTPPARHAGCCRCSPAASWRQLAACLARRHTCNGQQLWRLSAAAAAASAAVAALWNVHLAQVECAQQQWLQPSVQHGPCLSAALGRGTGAAAAGAAAAGAGAAAAAACEEQQLAAAWCQWLAARTSLAAGQDGSAEDCRDRDDLAAGMGGRLALLPYFKAAPRTVGAAA
jgi:hypothetical protein